MAKSISVKVVTGEVRLSYVYLIEPRKAERVNDKDKYSVCLLIPKTDIATGQL